MALKATPTVAGLLDTGLSTIVTFQNGSVAQQEFEEMHSVTALVPPPVKGTYSGPAREISDTRLLSCDHMTLFRLGDDFSKKKSGYNINNCAATSG